MSGPPQPPPGGFPGSFPPARPGIPQPGGAPQMQPGPGQGQGNPRPGYGAPGGYPAPLAGNGPIPPTARPGPQQQPAPPGYPTGPVGQAPGVAGAPGMRPAGAGIPARGPLGQAPAGFAGPSPGVPQGGITGPPRGPPGSIPGQPGMRASPGPPPGAPGGPPGQTPVRGPPGPLSSPFPGSQLPGQPRPGGPGVHGQSLPGAFGGPGGVVPSGAPGAFQQQQVRPGMPGAGPPGLSGPGAMAPPMGPGGIPGARPGPGFPTRPGSVPLGQPPMGGVPPGGMRPPGSLGPGGIGGGIPPIGGGPPGSTGGAPPPPAGFMQQPGPPAFGAPPSFGTPSGPPPPGADAAQMMGSLSLGPGQGPPQGMPPGMPPGGPPGMPGQMPPGSRGGLVPPPPPMGGQPPPPPGMGRPAAAPFTGQPSGGPQASRIDPNQIPRPQPQAPSAGALVFETRVNNAANIPPPATSQFVVRDTGNCSPRVMRSTLTYIPCSHDLLNTSGMPLALIVQPMGAPGPSDTQIQCVDFGEMGPVRCQRCKAYINPFVRFVDQGRRFICNLCGCTNETPRDYVCNLGPDGRRRDADERPELTNGSVDFVAPKDYMVRDPMPPVFFFLIDVSLNALTTGATASACSALKQVLEDLSGDESAGYGDRIRTGLATFNSSIHFYSLNPSLQQPSILIVPDIEDPYTPLPSDLVVPLKQCKEKLESLLDLIPSLYADTKVADSCFGAAVSAGYLAVKETGGKVIVFQSVLPSVGLGALSAREADGRANAVPSDKEAMKLLQPLDKNLRTIASEFADFQVSVDVFVTCQGFCDLASVAVYPRITGGQLYHYFPFNPQSDAAKLYNDLRWTLLRAQGLEAIMKVRCSNGLTVSAYAGNFNHRIPAEIYLPAVDCDKAILVHLKHEDKLIDNTEACLQCAILYTTTSGQRRVRVHTLSVPTTTSLASVFRGADLDAQVTFFLKKAAADVVSHPVQTVREAAITSCVNILFAYRKFCASASSSGQLILPEALKLLPLYTLALNKGLGLRTDGKIDERSYWLFRVRMLPTSMAIPLVYPRLYPLHSTATDYPQKDDGPMQLPPSLALSSEKLDQDAVLLLENGEDAIIWVGRGAAPESLSSLFGVKSFEELASGPFVLPQLDNPLSKRANDILNVIRQMRSSYLRMRLVRRGDTQEAVFLSHLIEDRSQAGMSYVEFLVYVHRQIQNKMA